MTLKRTIIISVSALLILAVGIFIFFGGYDMRPHRALDRFSRLVQEGDFADIRLIIYYMDPTIHIRVPSSVDSLKHRRYSSRVVVEGEEFLPHIDLIQSINSSILIPVEKRGSSDIRIYFVFETSRGRKIFDVAMWTNWGYGWSDVLVNGHPFRGSSVFNDIILAFLPEDEVRGFEWMLNQNSD